MCSSADRLKVVWHYLWGTLRGSEQRQVGCSACCPRNPCTRQWSSRSMGLCTPKPTKSVAPPSQGPPDLHLHRGGPRGSCSSTFRNSHFDARGDLRLAALITDPVHRRSANLMDDATNDCAGRSISLHRSPICCRSEGKCGKLLRVTYQCTVHRATYRSERSSSTVAECRLTS